VPQISAMRTGTCPGGASLGSRVADRVEMRHRCDPPDPLQTARAVGR